MPNRGFAAALHRLLGSVRATGDGSSGTAPEPAVGDLDPLESRLVEQPRNYALREQLSSLYLRRGRLASALRHTPLAVDLARDLPHDADREFVLSGASANLAAVFAARADRAGEWQSLLAGLAVRPESGCLNYQLAIRPVQNGDLDGALQAIAIACRDPRSYPRDWFAQYARRDQQLAPLPRDPRFHQMCFASRSAA